MKKLLFIGVNLLFTLNILFGQGSHDEEFQLVNSKDPIPPSPTAASLGIFGEVPVSLYTGMPQINYPLWDVRTESNFPLSISLSYHASGIKVADRPGWVGAGWSLNAGGVITRTMYGLPDEQINSGYMDQAPLLLPNPNDGNFHNFYSWEPFSTYAEQMAKGLIDLEPDMFFYNFNGKSGKIYIDPYADISKRMVAVPHENWLIVPNNDFTEFTITTDDGTKYFFGGASGTEKTYLDVKCSDLFIPKDHYISSWYLKRIQLPDAKGSISFSYDAKGDIITPTLQETKYHSNGAIEAGPCRDTNCPNKNDYECESEAKHSQIFLKEIRTDLETIEFFVNPIGESGIHKLDSIVITDKTERYSKSLNFNYDISGRHFLREVKGLYPEPIKFDYYPGMSVAFGSYAQDLWGYYNGENTNNTLVPEYHSSGLVLDGANRRPVFDEAIKGTLKKVTYPTKGTTTFNYEANKAYNVSKITEYFEDYVDIQLEKVSGTNLETVSETFSITFDQSVLIECDITNNRGYEVDGKVEIINLASGEVERTYNNSTDEYLYLNIGDYEIVGSLEIQDNEIDARVNFRDFSDKNEYNRTVGGIRIREIISDPLKGPSIIKRYSYINKKFPDRSSGYMPGELPAYEYTTVDVNTCSAGISTVFYYQYGCNYMVRNGSAVKSLASTSGSLVGYDYVVEYAYKVPEDSGTSESESDTSSYPFVDGKIPEFTGDEAYLGMTCYDYLSPKEVANNNWNGYPSAPPNDRDWARGKPEIIEYYDSENKLLKKVENEYNIIEPDDAPELRIIPGYKATYFYPAEYFDDFTNWHDCYRFQPYYVKAGWSHPFSSKTTTFDSEGKQVVEYVEYKYGQYDKLLKESKQVLPNGDSIIKSIKYTLDFNDNADLNDLQYASIDYLYQNRMDNKPISIDQYLKNVEGEKNLSSSVVEYENSDPSRLYAIDEVSINAIPSDELYTNWVTSLDNYDKSLEISYDTKGRVTKQVKRNGESISYLYDSGIKAPVAKVIGVDGEQCRYYSFENSIVIGVEPKDAKAGIGCVSTDVFEGQLIMGLEQGTYQYEYWWKATLDDEWELKKGELTIESDTGAYVLNYVPGYTDELRIFPEGAQMFTYTYHPFFGVTSETDANNRTTYYEYDEYGRLKTIKDEEKNILKAYNYAYSRTSTKEFKVNGNEIDFALDINTNAENTIINIESNMYWTVSTDVIWLTLDMLSGVGSQDLTIIPEINEGTESREADIIFTTDGKSIKLTLSQEPDFLDVTTNSITTDYKPLIEAVTVSSTTDWTVNIEPTCDWVTVNPDNGTGNQEINIIIDKNGGTGSRSVQVDITTALNTESILIVQDGQFLEFPQGNIELGYRSQQISFDVNSNLTWHLGVVAIGSWIEVINGSDTGDGSILLSFSENDTGADRLDTLLLLGGDKAIEIPILQRSVVLTSSLSNIDFDFNGTPQSMTISAEASWSVTSKPDWLNLSITSNIGDAFVSVSALGNLDIGSDKTGTLTIESLGKVLSIPVTQEAYPLLLISPPTTNFDFYGGNATINITSDQTWTLSKDRSWISLNKTSGTNNGSFTVTCSQNTDGTDRSGTITLQGGGLTQNITITQDGPVLTVDNTSFTYEPEGEVKSFNITSNINWTVTSSETWVTVSNPSGNSNGSCNLTIGNYEGSSDRTATITISGEGITRSISITQAAPYINPTSTSVNLGCGVDNKHINIQSNVAWNLLGPKFIHTWLAYTINRNGENGSIQFDCQANDGTLPRTASFTIEGGNLSKTITVTQASGAIDISTSSMNFEYEGGTATFSISTSADWTISSNQFWLTVDKDSGTGNAIIRVTCGQAGTTDRNGTITISTDAETKYINVNQEGSLMQ